MPGRDNRSAVSNVDVSVGASATKPKGNLLHGDVLSVKVVVDELFGVQWLALGIREGRFVLFAVDQASLQVPHRHAVIVLATSTGSMEVRQEEGVGQMLQQVKR